MTDESKPNKGRLILLAIWTVAMLWMIGTTPAKAAPQVTGTELETLMTYSDPFSWERIAQACRQSASRHSVKTCATAEHNRDRRKHPDPLICPVRTLGGKAFLKYVPEFERTPYSFFECDQAWRIIKARDKCRRLKRRGDTDGRWYVTQCVKPYGKGYTKYPPDPFSSN